MSTQMFKCDPAEEVSLTRRYFKILVWFGVIKLTLFGDVYLAAIVFLESFLLRRTFESIDFFVDSIVAFFLLLDPPYYWLC